MSLIAFFAPNNKIDSSYLMLAVYFGVELIAGSFIYLFFDLNKQRMDSVQAVNYHRVLIFLCGILSLLALLISINRWLGPDEFEHIHSAWYVAEGLLPYTDFFQHHHPLLWYSLAPLLRIFGYTVKAVVILRILMFLLSMGIAYLTYRLSEKISGSRETALLSVILLLSTVMFVERSIEIRPDVPQVFFGMVSVYALISYFRSEELKHIAITALAAAVSFFFLQKTVFLLIAYAVIFLVKLLSGKVSYRVIGYFGIWFSLPVLIFFTFLTVRSGSLNTYFITNVAVNTDRSLASFSPFVHVKAAAVLNGFFWLLASFSLLYTLLMKRVGEEMRAIAFIASVILLSFFIVKHPYEQYIMQAIPLVCVTVGWTFSFFLGRYKTNYAQALIMIFVVIAVPLAWLSHRGLHSTNSVQLEKADYVIRNSAESDFVYDGSNQFNLFRRDLHYFWYNFEKLPVFNRLTNDRYGGYDPCSLIKSRRPAFISDYRISMDKCGLTDLYTGTRYDGLFVRKAKQGAVEFSL